MIQIGTVNTNTDPSDYWDETFFETVEFECSVMDTTRDAHITEERLTDVMSEADYDTFIVDHNPELMYDHPDAAVRIEAYDGYNE